MKNTYIINQQILDENDNVLADWNLETYGFYDLEFSNYKEAKKCFNQVKKELPEDVDYYKKKSNNVRMETIIMSRPNNVANYDWNYHDSYTVNL